MSLSPKRGEIWLVDLEPVRGSELKKQRPAIIISSDSLGALAVKLVVPLTAWNPNFQGKSWHVQMIPSAENGLNKISSADTLQTRTVSLQRFIKPLGKVTADDLERLTAALVIVIEHEPTSA
jgi:mRNA interferase MazF